MKLRTILFAFVLGTAGLEAADRAGFEDSLRAGRTSLELGDASAAFGHFQRAAQADPAHYEGYFYLAVAAYRMANFTAAAEYADLALQRAPAVEQARVREMIGVIGEKKEFARRVQEGDEAFGKGLMAKAADAYANAYRLFPNQGSAGLKAATIYAGQLERLLEAATLWQKIAAEADAASATAAREELGRRAAELERLYASRMAQLEQFKKAANPAPLVALVAAFPAKLDARVELAAIYAGRRETRSAIAQLVEANKLGLKPGAFQQRKEFIALLQPTGDAEFAQFVTDAYGGNVAAAMRAVRQRIVVPGVRMELVPIAPGRFSRGSPSSEPQRETNERQHGVQLTSAYWLGKHEVTQAQWIALMGHDRPNLAKVNLPVENVSWSSAMEFCRRLTARERSAGRLVEGYAYTLPTEAQWEYAARAGTTGMHAGDVDAMAWTSRNSQRTAHPVGTKRANGWGLHDMHGNVWEWCLDWLGDYPSGTVVDPKGPATGTQRVQRGGSYLATATRARSAVRASGQPEYTPTSATGFRVALVATR